MNLARMHAFFERRREASAPLVLATVYATRGSTYSKAGARMLIDGDGVFQGMLSGGCLEGDLAARARVVLDTGKPLAVTYALDADDELWGLGVGCDGEMQILLQPLLAANAYQPYAAIAACETERGAAHAAVITSGEEALLGQTAIVGADGDLTAKPDRHADVLTEFARGGDAGIHDVVLDDAEVGVLVSRIDPFVRLLVLGAGLDAEPLVNFAAELGWRCTVADHRPAYVDGNDFARAERRVCCPAAELSEHLDLDGFDLAIVMSHHLTSDREYLRQLQPTGIAYIGLLGPRQRRERLLSELEDAGNLAARVHGPAGLDLGGRGAGAIALSIVAEMQTVIAKQRA